MHEFRHNEPKGRSYRGVRRSDIDLNRCSDGLDAVRKVRELKPDLILLEPRDDWLFRFLNRSVSADFVPTSRIVRAQ